jgi:phage shock protein C
MICSACSSEMNPTARFCSNCGRAVVGPPVIPVYPRLMRPRSGRAIAGVCAGFAQRYGWDVVLVRILLCVSVLFGCGAPILAYLVAWIVMPNEPYFFPVQPMAPPVAQPAAPPNNQPTV